MALVEVDDQGGISFFGGERKESSELCSLLIPCDLEKEKSHYFVLAFSALQ